MVSQESSGSLKRLKGKDVEKRILNKVIPRTPDSFRMDDSQGTILTYVTVGKTGNVEQVQFISSLKRFDSFVNEALWKWRFRPLMSEGEPVRFKALIPFYICWGGRISDQPIKLCS